MNSRTKQVGWTLLGIIDGILVGACITAPPTVLSFVGFLGGISLGIGIVVGTWADPLAGDADEQA